MFEIQLYGSAVTVKLWIKTMGIWVSCVHIMQCNLKLSHCVKMTHVAKHVRTETSLFWNVPIAILASSDMCCLFTKHKKGNSPLHTNNNKPFVSFILFGLWPLQLPYGVEPMQITCVAWDCESS